VGAATDALPPPPAPLGVVGMWGWKGEHMCLRGAGEDTEAEMEDGVGKGVIGSNKSSCSCCVSTLTRREGLWRILLFRTPLFLVVLAQLLLLLATPRMLSCSLPLELLVLRLWSLLFLLISDSNAPLEPSTAEKVAQTTSDTQHKRGQTEW
jgi:hypothetical protein